MSWGESFIQVVCKGLALETAPRGSQQIPALNILLPAEMVKMGKEINCDDAFREFSPRKEAKRLPGKGEMAREGSSDMKTGLERHVAGKIAILPPQGLGQNMAQEVD